MERSQSGFKHRESNRQLCNWKGLKNKKRAIMDFIHCICVCVCVCVFVCLFIMNTFQRLHSFGFLAEVGVSSFSLLVLFLNSQYHTFIQFIFSLSNSFVRLYLVLSPQNCGQIWQDQFVIDLAKITLNYWSCHERSTDQSILSSSCNSRPSDMKIVLLKFR